MRNDNQLIWEEFQSNITESRRTPEEGFTTHNYEFNWRDGTVTDLYGDKISGVEKSNRFDNGDLGDFC